MRKHLLLILKVNLKDSKVLRKTQKENDQFYILFIPQEFTKGPKVISFV
jgi:hypothetical protein